MSEQRMNADVVVTGAGLSGLTAAAYLARAGKKVIVLDKASEIGGRAMTQTVAEFSFNLGPHALYRKGPAARILNELGVSYAGRRPSLSGNYAIWQGRKETLPGGFISLLTTGLMSLPAKFEAARLLAGISQLRPAELERISVQEWLAQTFRHDPVRQLVLALIRVSSYTNDPERQSAGAAIAQLQAAVSYGVDYIDGGWATLVNGLRRVAVNAGTTIVTGSSVAGIARYQHGYEINTRNGTCIAAGSVVLALDPAETSSLLPADANTELSEWAAQAIPVRAACLDVALRQLPVPQATFALGLDQPLYFSVHSATATLTPPDGALIHVLKYLHPQSRPDAGVTQQELELTLDMMQPGWRDLVVHQRFLPQLTVTHAQVTAAMGGLSGRPGPAIPGCAGLYIAGDWVGPEGQLADACFASARNAAQMILAGQSHQAAAA